MTKEAKTTPRPDFFKKVSTLILLIGGIIAAIWGGYQIFQEVSHVKEIQKELNIQLSIGDSFLERFEHERAIEEYEKALELNKDNVEACRRIITAKREKFQIQNRRGIHLLEPGKKINAIGWEVPQEGVDDALALIYRLRALNPSLKDDLGLLLEEALLLDVGEYFKASIMVFKKAHKLSPQDPDVLAELGRLRSQTSSDENIEGLDLLRRAIAIRPDEPRYHYYLGDALVEAGFGAEAIREYNRTVKLADGQDHRSEQLRRDASCKLMWNFCYYYYYSDEERLLCVELDMPLEERVQVLENCFENCKLKYGYVWEDPCMYLAHTYYELGDLKKAANTIQSGLPDDKGEWSEEIYMLVALAMILEEGGFDPTTLEEVRAMIVFDAHCPTGLNAWPQECGLCLVA
jgi:tetratricopeptide (TPR) repeat protein